MKIHKSVLLLPLLLLGSGARAQQSGQLGGGVVLGVPIGGTVKYWLSDRQAVDAGVGFDGEAVLYGDFLWHGWDIFPQPDRGKLGAYVGLGPRIKTTDDVQFAIRTIGGFDYWIANHPIELFLEGGPAFRLAPSVSVNADIGAGLRFYFGGRAADEKLKKQ